MRGANRLDIKAQLLIAAILVSATGTVMAAETADQTSPPAAAAATEVATPKADTVKKPDARKPRVETADQTASPAVVAATESAGPRAEAVKKPEVRKTYAASTWRCGWGLLSWMESCSSHGRVGLVLGTAY